MSRLSQILLMGATSSRSRCRSHSPAAGEATPGNGGFPNRSRLVVDRRRQIAASPKIVFDVIRRLGGREGWYYGNWVWRMRGAIDELLGGVGMRRERRHPIELRIGDVVDCWRVEQIEENRRLELLAEMKLPGRAWLVFEVEESNGQSTVCQMWLFEPAGWIGLVYWYALYPVHVVLWRGMLRELCRAAKNTAPASR